MIEAGAVGLKIHEDWGAYPEIIDATLRLADAHDIAVCLHTDGLNESCELEDTVAAIGGRAVHAYHVEGVGGGHIPDLIGLVREPNVVCSSTTPTIPYGTHTAAEHLRDDPAGARRLDRLARRRRRGAGTHPPGHDGGRGPAARPGRDRHRELRLAGDGPDRRDGPADVAARATR